MWLERSDHSLGPYEMKVQFKCISLLGLVQVVRKHQYHSIKLVHVPSNLLANANIKANHVISIVTFGSLWSVPLLSYFTAWVIARFRFNSLLVTLLRLCIKRFTMINSAWWLRTNSIFSRQEFKDIHLFCLQSSIKISYTVKPGRTDWKWSWKFT